MEQGNPVGFGIDGPVHQNREIRRACDACRKRKRRCDGPVRSHVNDSKCAHRSRYDLDCTYTQHVPTQRGPLRGYLEMVEQRCGRLEQLLRQAVPDIDLDEYVGPPIDPETFDIVDYKVHSAKFVSDPRVKIPDDIGGYHPYSAGWRYMRVLLRTGYNFLQSPSLYSLQKTVLVCQFFQGSSTVPHTLPVISSLGLRFSEELGIHVGQLLHHVNPVERELYTRAFWCLYHIDRYNCTFVGRSVAMRDCDFDIEYPKDVDNEYWQLDFKQSEVKVSRVAVFIQTCKLDRIVGRIMQTFYTVESSSQPVVSLRRAADEISADLDVWTEELLSVLHWDPERGDYRIFQQTAALHTYFHYCKILIYRPFISSSGSHPKNDPLETCLSASYSISDILSACLHRGRRESCQPGHSLDISYILPPMVFWHDHSRQLTAQDPLDRRIRAGAVSCQGHSRGEQG